LTVVQCVLRRFLNLPNSGLPDLQGISRCRVRDRRHLLYGLIARHKAQDKFRVTGEYLSYDPYGIMFRKGEPQLTAVVERTFRKLGSNRDLVPLYNKWFVARLPTGEKLNVAISPQLEEAFKVLNDSEGTSN
jgi:glutamate/aspartate transport system substrate-binding protein